MSMLSDSALEPRGRAPAPAARRAPRSRPARSGPPTSRSIWNVAGTALAKSVLSFAAAHVLVLIVHGVIHRDVSGFNLFTMVEAQRLWPALAAGAAAPWSLGFGLIVYLGVLGALARRRWGPRRVLGASALADHRRRALAASASSWPEAPNGHGTNGGIAGPVSLARQLAPSAARPSTAGGWLALVGGLSVHMTALASIGRLVASFPAIPDIVHERLPYVDFGVPGELAYAAFMLAVIVVLVRQQPKTVPAILLLLGLFYAVRGVFLFLLPIGIPPTAPPLAERFVLWPYAGHAYFPGGHTGMMTVLSLSVVSKPWRRVFLAATLAFALGTLVARTHYSADAFGGWLVGYAIVSWGRRRFEALAQR